LWGNEWVDFCRVFSPDNTKNRNAIYKIFPVIQPSKGVQLHTLAALIKALQSNATDTPTSYFLTPT